MRRAVFALLLGVLPLSAAASLRVGQIHLQGVELSVMADAVQRYLEDLGEDAAEGRARRNLLLVSALPDRAASAQEPGTRFHLLLDSTPGGVDPRLFAALSRLSGVRVLRTELDGSTLSWRRQARRGGGKASASMPGESPRRGFGAVPHDAPLPLYKDVEQEAWRWLAARGVEPALRLQGLRAFSPMKRSGVATREATDVSGAAPGRAAIAFELRPGFAPRRVSLRVRLPETREGPPVQADARLPGGMGEPGQTIDLIHLSGTPVPVRVARLARLLLAIQARYRRALRRPFCHLVEGQYRRPLYTRLAAMRSPCRKVYRTLLARLRARLREEKPPEQRPLPEAH